MAVSKIEPFRVEQWMDAYETTAKHNIAETCAASISIDDLYKFANEGPGRIFSYGKKLLYGDIRGSYKLRSNIAALYSDRGAADLSTENLLVTSGAISANFLVLYALVGKGDHVICHHPTYQQLYSVPASFGAEVDLWRSKPEDDWQLDIKDLENLLRPTTKLIILNNPQNPTGAVIPKSTIEQVIKLTKERSIYILSDEVYQPLFHSIQPDDPELPPPILATGYDKAIAVGSMSKAYAMAGLRIGWIASRSTGLIDIFARARDYTTISVSMIDDQVAAFATSHPCVDSLLSRNRDLALVNLAILERFVRDHQDRCEWVKPAAGTTAFVRFSRHGKPVDDVELCKLLHREKGILVCPGSLCFGDEVEFKGYVRIGYVCETQALEGGLQEMRSFMQEGFEKVPLAQS